MERSSILLTCLLVSSFCFSADYVVNGRVIAEFSAIPANRVSAMQTFIANQYDKSSDLYSVNSQEFRTETNGGVISGAFMLDFTLSNKAAQVWSALTNYSWPAGVTGQVSMHMCAITNNQTYVPCNGTGAPTFYLFRKIR